MLFYLTALALGAAGSLHCVGMCGPLAISMHPPGVSIFSGFIGGLVYNLGRAFSYALLGSIMGIIGYSLSWFGWQQGLSILAGTVAVAISFMNLSIPVKVGGGLMSAWRSYAGRLLNRKGLGFRLLLGVLNGLLPCGLVYAALAASSAAHSTFESALFMFCFGMGTVPLMWALVFGGIGISAKWRGRMSRIYPFVSMLLGVILIIRGLGLNIPYLSPIVGMDRSSSVPCY